MGKFNKRRTPPKVGFSNTVQYGHRGSFFIVNGLRYNGVTGEVLPSSEQQFAAYDSTAREDVTGGWPVALPGGGDVMPPIAAEAFEPGLLANSFDLLGSRSTSEHAQGQYWNYGTWRSPSGHYYFKNRIYYQPSYFSVDSESRVTSAGEDGYLSLGTVVPNITRLGGWNCTSHGIGSGNSINYVPEGHFLPVEKPSSNFNKFSWATLPAYSVSQSQPGPGSPSTALTVRVSEKTFGNTLINFSNGQNNGANPGSVSFPSNPAAATFRFWPATGHTFGLSNLHLSKSGIVDTEYVSANLELSDVHLFGGNVLSFTPTVISGPAGINRQLNVFGGYLYTNRSNVTLNQGSGESGVRVFLTRNDTYSFYMLYDSEQGGIQGCDTGADNTARLTVRSLNHSTGATSVQFPIKKGVGGLVIPSQGDTDTNDTYTFYMISFNGADTATQTLSIVKPTINLQTGVATLGNVYVNTMSNVNQQQFYSDMGHNNTSNGVWPSTAFRRNTVYRVWYSTSLANTRRLHLGIYNTNGTGIVTIGNGFNSSGGRGSMYKVYTWEINDATETATYIGSTNLNEQAPRYFYPLDAGWRDVYVGAVIGNDIIMSLSNTTGQYQKTIDMPYNAARLFKDKDGRWNAQVADLSVPVVSNVYGSYTDVISADVARTVSITATDRIFSYSGNTINSSIIVNVFNYQGDRLAKNVVLSIIGQSDAPGVTFEDGSYTRTITTSTSANTIANVRIISAVSAKIVGTVLES